MSSDRAPRVAIATSAALLLAVCVGCGPTGRSPSVKPNLVLISIDTLRADHVGAYGYSLPTTPQIDALAGDAVRFANASSQAPSTLLSHASIFTSRLPHQNGASIGRASRLTDSSISLAELLQARGYATASFNGGIQLDAVYGLDRGFDVYVSAHPYAARPQALAGPEDRLGHGVNQALAWLDGVGGPFFLFLHSYEIHHPYTPDPEDLALFERGLRRAAARPHLHRTAE